MDRIRYPLGLFEPIQNPTQVQRARWVMDMLALPAELRSTVEPLTRDQLFTPYRPGGWTVQQVVHHMADNDINAYIRFKLALTEDATLAGTYREDLWAEQIDYEAPIELSIGLLDALHRRFAALLLSLPSIEFQITFTSPTHGPMSLDVATQRFAWHGRHHLAQITALIERSGW